MVGAGHKNSETSCALVLMMFLGCGAMAWDLLPIRIVALGFICRGVDGGLVSGRSPADATEMQTRKSNMFKGILN